MNEYIKVITEKKIAGFIKNSTNDYINEYIQVITEKITPPNWVYETNCSRRVDGTRTVTLKFDKKKYELNFWLASIIYRLY